MISNVLIVFFHPSYPENVPTCLSDIGLVTGMLAKIACQVVFQFGMYSIKSDINMISATELLQCIYCSL